MCRGDLGPVDAWRVIMSLRSGLLSESCYALDVLNILLFDDSAVSYFGLNQWPGLLDLLLEHFLKSLAGMFDEKQPEIEKEHEEIDLGGVNNLDCSDNKKSVVILKTANYTLVTRKGIPVKFIERNDDIFIQDNLKDWDNQGDAAGINVMDEVVSDPWYIKANYILPTFQAEFGRIPFNKKAEEKLEKSGNGPPPEEPEPHRTPPPEEVRLATTKQSDKRRRTKTLSDVISRIKKDTSEGNDSLALEIKSKVKTEPMSSEKLNCDEQTSVDLNPSVNGEFSASNSSVRDPAATLKRRRMSDYEDEAYTRDEASLTLLTESHNNIGKRCVCISNILRSLTFIPGNEGEFSKNSTFLGLVGKLLLLHHDHPLRMQKTHNYDREVCDVCIPIYYLYVYCL